jgi:hypothetical protein
MRDDCTASAGTTISVEFSTLRVLAAQLRDLALQLSTHCAIVQPELDSDLFGKLTAVENDWTAHRHKLQSFLSDTATSVDGIVAEYEKTDDMVADAAAS